MNQTKYEPQSRTIQAHPILPCADLERKCLCKKFLPLLLSKHPIHLTALFSSLHRRLAAIPPIKILQYEICPFCNKLKAVLDYYKVPYTTVSKCARQAFSHQSWMFPRGIYGLPHTLLVTIAWLVGSRSHHVHAYALGIQLKKLESNRSLLILPPENTN